MTSFDVIIPLGASCAITFLLQKLHLKKETGLFEWFASLSLSSIVKILNNVSNTIDTPIIQKGPNIYMDDTDIYSCHYKKVEFEEIYKRRAERLYNIVRTNTRILFIRLEEYNKPNFNYDDLQRFFENLQKINPNTSEMKLFIIHNHAIDKYIEHPSVIYKYNQNIGKDIFLTELRNYLKELGYNIDDTNNTIFNDRS